MKSAVSGRGIWGVWMIGGLRNAAISCGGGPEVIGRALERWLSCDCCWARSDSSLSEDVVSPCLSTMMPENEEAALKAALYAV